MNILLDSLQKCNSLDIIMIDISDQIDIHTNLDIVVMIPPDSHIIPELLNKSKNLKWVHCMSAGVEKLVQIKQLVDSDVILTN